MNTPPPVRTRMAPALAAGALAVILLANVRGTAGAWDGFSRILSLQGKPEPVSAAMLSEHHAEALDAMPPQAQAEFLLERAINHYAGAGAEIAARVPSWRAKLEPSDHFETLFRMAINSDDLRVRAAGIEINIVTRRLEKSSATVDRLEPAARAGAQGARANALWDLGMIGNRGTEPGRIADILIASLRDENVNIRYWAVEALAYLGTDRAIEPLLDVFHDDRSGMIRERAACGLAQSGMLSREQRMQAVPRMIEYAGDFSLDDETRGWAFQALRDITGQNLPRDPSAWRAWYERQR